MNLHVWVLSLLYIILPQKSQFKAGKDFKILAQPLMWVIQQVRKPNPLILNELPWGRFFLSYRAGTLFQVSGTWSQVSVLLQDSSLLGGFWAIVTTQGSEGVCVFVRKTVRGQERTKWLNSRKEIVYKIEFSSKSQAFTAVFVISIDQSTPFSKLEGKGYGRSPKP